MEHEGTVVDELTLDHREVAAVFEEIQTLPSGAARRRELADAFTVALVRHAVAEELYLYPAVREHVPGGRELVAAELEDHAAVERLLKDLERADVEGQAFDATVATLIAEVRTHVKEEEEVLFPALVGACSPRRLQELGDRLRATRGGAPTRPRPEAPPAGPSADAVPAPGAGLVDRTRDLVTGRGRV